MEAIRGFAAFLHAHDPAHEIPLPGLFPRRRLRAVPYLYSPAGEARPLPASYALSGAPCIVRYHPYRSPDETRIRPGPVAERRSALNPAAE